MFFVSLLKLYLIVNAKNGQWENLSIDYGGLSILKDENLVYVYNFLLLKMSNEEITIDFQGLPCK